MPEVRLPGGFVSDVERVGATVRRTQSANAGFAHELLDLFARHGWAGAPRFLGVDAVGREMLSYLDGHVAWRPVQPPEVFSDESLAAAARLVRQFHDPTAGSRLAAVRGLRLLCGSYGLADRGDLIETVMWWQDRCWRGIEAAAATGDPAGVRLRDAGVVREVRAARDWVADHRHELEDGIR